MVFLGRGVFSFIHFHFIFTAGTLTDVPIPGSAYLPRPHRPPSLGPSPHSCLGLRVTHTCSFTNVFTFPVRVCVCYLRAAWQR